MMAQGHKYLSCKGTGFETFCFSCHVPFDKVSVHITSRVGYASSCTRWPHRQPCWLRFIVHTLAIVHMHEAYNSAFRSVSAQLDSLSLHCLHLQLVCPHEMQPACTMLQCGSD